jgi:lysozyme family protein
MSDYLEQALKDLSHNEGGYTVDNGGETKYGITEPVARRHGYVGNMKDLPYETAKEIYQQDGFWPNWLDTSGLPYYLQFNIFDCCVNSGPKRALMILQQTLGVTADGILGPNTLGAIDKCDPLKTCIMFNYNRGTFMSSLDAWTTAGKGWFRRILFNLSIITREIK